MSGHRTIPSPRRRASIAGSLLALLALTACDTGDGTSLRLPTAPTTQPPIESAPLPSEAIDDPGREGAPPLETVPDGSLGSEGAGGVEGQARGLQVFTPWADDGAIDIRYTCDGSNISPPISWTEMPVGTAEIAISMVDPSNLSTGRPFIHWVMAGIDPTTDRLGEDELPLGAVRGLNFFGDIGYTGPCPDPGTTGSFVVTVFALSQQVELADGTPAAELLDLIATVAIDTSSTTGTSTR